MNEQEKRQALIDVCQWMNDAGLNQGTAGNASLRHESGFLITPSAIPYNDMRPEQVVFVELQGDAPRPPEGPLRPSSEWRFHHDILFHRPEVNAVLHLHPPHGTALACLREGIPQFHYMVAVAGGRDIRCAEYHTFGTPELSAAILKAMQGRRACLMANHGMLTVGEDLIAARELAIEVEALAGQYLLALNVGEPTLLTDAEMDAVLEKFADYKQH